MCVRTTGAEESYGKYIYYSEKHDTSFTLEMHLSQSNFESGRRTQFLFNWSIRCFYTFKGLCDHITQYAGQLSQFFQRLATPFHSMCTKNDAAGRLYKGESCKHFSAQ